LEIGAGNGSLPFIRWIFSTYCQSAAVMKLARWVEQVRHQA
jgi:hypothetical protein